MPEHWFAQRAPGDASIWWVRKAGAEHYGEHLPQLRMWAAELVDARTRPPSDEWDSLGPVARGIAMSFISLGFQRRQAPAAPIDRVPPANT
jgi:hypothetical protein